MKSAAILAILLLVGCAGPIKGERGKVLLLDSEKHDGTRCSLLAGFKGVVGKCSF